MSPDEPAIRNVVSLWHRATAAGDVETVLGLMAEDVVFLVARCEMVSGGQNMVSDTFSALLIG